MQQITEDRVARAQQYGYQFDIGQLTLLEQRTLRQRVNQGLTVQVQAPWPWLLSGLCTKPCYVHVA
jgi:hypothetical protein